DDLQWCDRETCALLHFLARRCEGVPLALVVTLKRGELERDAPAARLCRALRTRPSAVAISLAPLGEDEVWQMIRQLGHLQAPGAGRRLARRLHEVSDGNPFHVIELLKALFAQGMLEADPATGEWRAPSAHDASPGPGVVLPGSVRVVLLERVGRLPSEVRDLLATIAVTGRGTSSALLSPVHGMSRPRVAAPAAAGGVAGRRTADVLRLAGWSQPPPSRVGRRRSSAGTGIERPDVDLRTTSERN